VGGRGDETLQGKSQGQSYSRESKKIKNLDPNGEEKNRGNDENSRRLGEESVSSIDEAGEGGSEKEYVSDVRGKHTQPEDGGGIPIISKRSLRRRSWRNLP